MVLVVMFFTCMWSLITALTLLEERLMHAYIMWCSQSNKPSQHNQIQGYGEQRRYGILENSVFSLYKQLEEEMNYSMNVHQQVCHLSNSQYVFLLDKWDQQNVLIAKILFFKASDKPLDIQHTKEVETSRYSSTLTNRNIYYMRKLQQN